MKALDYWATRAEQVLLAGERRGEALIKAITGFYADTARQIQTQIESFYGRYAKENVITLTEARKLLNKGGIKSFRAEMSRYLAESAQLRLGNMHEQYLRRLSTRAAISRQQELLAQVRHRIEVLAAENEAAFAAALEEVYAESYYRTLFDLQYGVGLGADFSRMDTGTVERLLRTPWLEGNYSSRIWANKTSLIQQLEQIIPQAFAIGRNSQALGRQIASRLGVSQHAGERLARTEVNHAANESTRLAYKEYGVKKYEYLATLDNRTSEICAALDGKVYRLSDAAAGINYPPMHPNCRSTTVPYFPPDEFDGPSSRAARDADGKYYTVPAGMTYAEWKKRFVDSDDVKAYNNTMNSNAKNTGASGAIPRDDWDRMDRHAVRFYEEIRHRKTDVSTISKNTGFSEIDIEAVKQHIFFNEYDLGEDKPRRFDPSYDMAVSWQRLIEGKDIQEMDLVLLRHELLEYQYMSDGVPYLQAHKLTNEKYNYEAFILELDRKAGIK